MARLPFRFKLCCLTVMAPPAAKTRRVPCASQQSLSEEGRGRVSSGSFSSLSFHSQVIDDVEDDLETSRGKRSSRRRLSFDSNASGCSTTSSEDLYLLSKNRQSVQSITSSNAKRHLQSSSSKNWRVILQSLAELWIEQQVVSCGGDGNHWVDVVSEKLSSTEAQLDILELDGMELLDHDQELAVALFQDPDAFATELMDHILCLLSSSELWSRKGCLLGRPALVDAYAERGSRLWIRFKSVPLPLLPICSLQCRSSELTFSCVPTSSKQLVYVYGVVYAISNITRTYPPVFSGFLQKITIFRQRFRCKVCKNVYDAYYGCDLLLPTGCCQAWICEDVESHDYLPHQEILLGPVPNMATAGIHATAPNAFSSTLVSVSLFDDLTGRLEIGDSVALIGHASMYCVPMSVNSALPPSEYRFAEVRIKANNIFAPFNLNTLKVFVNPETSQAFCKSNGEVSLERLCNTLCRHGPGTQLWPKLLPIALLLSIVAMNSPTIEDHQQIPVPSDYPLLEAPNTTTCKGEFGITSRKQIHILVTAKSFSSASILQSLQAASMYASRSVHDAGGNRTFAGKVKQDDASKDKQMLHAGCIALSKGGVLVLDLSLLAVKNTKHLSDAMDRRYENSQHYKLEQISKSTTVWGFTHESPQECSNRGTADSRTRSLPPALVRGFDIAFEEPSDVLSNINSVQTLVMGFNKSTNISSFSNDLQQHLLAASSIPSVSISVKAHDLLCSYYLALRRNKEFSDGRPECMDDASISTLESLLRVAEACAKLCLRSEIQEIPDATLAIMLCENSNLTKFGRSFVGDRMMSDSDKGVSANRFDRALGTDELDRDLRDFHAQLTRLLHDPIP
ncbi:hypothetical protein GOP47_0029256 [Adiantum capillus-veneris]|nr:hypothetical protein GOP47_0029256 [Adiantum capillus-veneris]